MISRSTHDRLRPEAENVRAGIASWSKSSPAMSELVEWFACWSAPALRRSSLKELLPVHRRARGNETASPWFIRLPRVRAFGEYAVVVAVETLVNAEAGGRRGDSRSHGIARCPHRLRDGA